MMLVLNIYRHHHPMGNKKAMSSILDILTIYHRRIAKNEITHNNETLKRFSGFFIGCMSYRCIINLVVICQRWHNYQ